MNTRATTTDPGAKSAAEIEREVRQSRAEVEETLDAIQERLSPGQLLDQAVGYLRGGRGADFARNLGDSVAQNPIPVALVGVGLAWMMVAGQRRDEPGSYARDWHRDWDDEDGDDGGEPYAGGIYESGLPYESAPGAAYASDLDTDIGEGGHAPSLGERASDAGSHVGEQFAEARDRAKDAARRARENAEALGAGVSERLSAAGDRAAAATDRFRRRTRRAGAGAYRYGRRARQSALQAISEHPLMLGALGIAVGAALGAALPPSETEDEYMGEAGDAIQRRSATVGREQLHRARGAARAAYDEARAEAEEQGLTPEAAREAAKEAASSAIDKAGHVASAAVSAAEQAAATDTKPPERSSTT